MKHLFVPILLLLIAMAGPASAACMVRVPTSLNSDADAVGPTVPCNVRQQAAWDKTHGRSPKVIDPMKLIRNKMVAGEPVSPAELRQLADSGDDLAAYNLAKQIEETGEAAELPTAIAYYAQAVEAGRTFAIRPIVRLLDAGAAAGSPELLERSEKLLAKNALEDAAVANIQIT